METPTLPAVASAEKTVAEALRLLREGDLVSLAHSPLAQDALLDRWCVGAVPRDSARRGQAMQAMLAALIERLRPVGAHSWTALSWRSYNVLAGFYLEGRRISELAERMGVVEQTIYPIRAQATAALTALLHEEQQAPAAQPNLAIAALYPALPAAQQTLLRMVALGDAPLPALLLHGLARAAGLQQIEQQVVALLGAGVIAAHDSPLAYSVAAKLRPYLGNLLSPEERSAWHSAAGEYRRAQGEFLLAAQHLRAAASYDAAAALLIDHAQAITDAAQAGQLAALLAEFRGPELSPLRWAQLKLLAGDTAMHMQDVDTAIQAYQHALRVGDLHLKAEAYYKRGRAFRLRSVDEAQSHFAYGIQLLEDAGATDPLLLQLYLEQAWCWIQERQDFAEAEAALTRAAALAPPHDRARWAEVQNTWGMFFHHKGEYATAIRYRQQAWLAANEMQDTLALTKFAHNLGLDYMELKQYEQALRYFAQSAELAHKTANRQMQGLCWKSTGGCYFWLRQYEQAITFYLQAYTIFREMDNRNWQANTCYDLAEVYALLGQRVEMQRYFTEAATLAREGGLDRPLVALAALARAHAGLYPPAAELNERQQLAYDLVKQHGQITNQQYRDLTGVSPKQAARDLQAMVEQRALIRVGEGRATTYVLG